MNLFLSGPHGCYFDQAMNLYLAGSYSRPYIHEGMDLYLAGTFPCEAKLKGSLTAPDPMNLHLAGPSFGSARPAIDALPGPLKVLESFYYIGDWMLPYIRSGQWEFLLDSGAFTFMQDAKAKVDWDGYIERYARFIVENNVRLFFELDIDAVVGLPTVERLRAKLEALTGRRSIPVWHHSRGKQYWQRMIRDYDYVALGGMAADLDYRKRIEPMFPWFLSTARAAGSKVHALGYTSIEGLHRYPFYSVDSTAWIYGNRGGYLYHFDGRSITKIAAPAGKRLKARQVAVHNFNEWVKFQRYAERHL